MCGLADENVILFNVSNEGARCGDLRRPIFCQTTSQNHVFEGLQCVVAYSKYSQANCKRALSLIGDARSRAAHLM